MLTTLRTEQILEAHRRIIAYEDTEDPAQLEGYTVAKSVARCPPLHCLERIWPYVRTPPQENARRVPVRHASLLAQPCGRSIAHSPAPLSLAAKGSAQSSPRSFPRSLRATTSSLRRRTGALRGGLRTDKTARSCLERPWSPARGRAALQRGPASFIKCRTAVKSTRRVCCACAVARPPQRSQALAIPPARDRECCSTVPRAWSVYLAVHT